MDVLYGYQVLVCMCVRTSSLAWAGQQKLQLLLFAFCFLKAKTAFSFLPKAVKIQLFCLFIAFLTYEKFTAFLFAFKNQEKQKIQVAASLAITDPMVGGVGGWCRPVSIFSREKNEIVYTRHRSTKGGI